MKQWYSVISLLSNIIVWCSIFHNLKLLTAKLMILLLLALSITDENYSRCASCFGLQKCEKWPMGEKLKCLSLCLVTQPPSQNCVYIMLLPLSKNVTSYFQKEWSFKREIDVFEVLEIGSMNSFSESTCKEKTQKGSPRFSRNKIMSFWHYDYSIYYRWFVSTICSMMERTRSSKFHFIPPTYMC